MGRWRLCYSLELVFSPRVFVRVFCGVQSPQGSNLVFAVPLSGHLLFHFLSSCCPLSSPLSVHFRRDTLVPVKGGGVLCKEIGLLGVSGLYTIISVYYMYRFFASLISCFSILCNFGIGFCTYVSLTSYLASVCGMGSVGWLLVSC